MRYVSKGLTRSRTDRLSVVPAASSGSRDATGSTGAATGVPSPLAGEGQGGGSLKVTALRNAAATALKSEPEAKLSPAEKLEVREADPAAQAKAAASEKRAEARAKGYEGEACGECGNFTLVRNGTCMKCDTCGSTTGCS
jgi:ribonucleoside-diphosphate reductase alpha chain